MFLFGSSYSDAARELVRHDGPVDMAIAYVGGGAASQMGETSSPRRILCDVLSGGTNPHEVVELQKLPAVEIRHVDGLHAKVMVAGPRALVGSANFSDNGIGWHDGLPGNLVEAGYRVTEPAQLRKIRDWYQRYWDLSEDITPGLISQALENWNRRQAGRPRPAGTRFAITRENWRSYVGRGTKIILWRRRPTKEEAASEAQLPSGLAPAAKTQEHRYRRRLDRYHDWGDLLDTGPGMVYLDIEYKKNGNAQCHGARRSLANGHHLTRESKAIDVMEIISTIDGQHFGPLEREELVGWLQPVIRRHYLEWCEPYNPDGDFAGVVVDLDEILQAAFGAAPAAKSTEFEQLFALASRLSVPRGWRCVTVTSPGPEVRIGTGSKILQRKEVPALARVNLRLSIRDGFVRCGSYLSPARLASYGTPLKLSGAEGRHWVKWPLEATASLLTRMLEETRDRLHTQTGTT